MDYPDFPEVGDRLTKAASALLGENPTPSERYEAHLMVAIQILDSEFRGYPPGELEQYLIRYLAPLQQPQ